MPFFTQNPSYYLSVLHDDSTEPLHIGLCLGNHASHDDDGEQEQPESAFAAISSWSELASAIQQTRRSVRCLWLRVESEGAHVESDDILAALRALGKGLVGATAIESLVFEGQGIGIDQLLCLRAYLTRNSTIRGIKFLRTRLDAQSSLVLNDFMVGNPSLKVFDLTGNPRVDDETVSTILRSILRKHDRLETLNIFETVDEVVDAGTGITESGVEYIASFVSQTPSLSILRLRVRELSDTGLGQLAEIIKKKDCKLGRLEICGNFSDEGVVQIAEALKSNQSIRTLDLGMSENLTDFGGEAILQVVHGRDDSWESATTSNHTLQNVYISDIAGSSMCKELLAKLQSITNVDAHKTLQNKAWKYIDNNIEDLSSIGLKANLAPHLVSFVSARGGLESLYRFLHSRNNASELFNNPTPERVRLMPQMEKVKQDNVVLRALLRSEREVSQTIRSENMSLRGLSEEDEQHQKKAMARCLLLPFYKAFEMYKFFLDLLQERPSSVVESNS
ncbi:hypothetical protein ACHAWF_009515 [Thalassiosira exigua]